MKKKCPKCSSKAVKLYRNKTIQGKRRWISTAWFCTTCSYVYHVAQDTLIYRIGGDSYREQYQQHCPKCEKQLYRLYRHINPKHGVQLWVTMGWYCQLCKYVWLDKKLS